MRDAKGIQAELFQVTSASASPLSPPNVKHLDSCSTALSAFVDEELEGKTD